MYFMYSIYSIGLSGVVDEFRYRKVASSRLSWLVAHLMILRLFMKGKFDAYLLGTLVQCVQN